MKRVLSIIIALASVLTFGVSASADLNYPDEVPQAFIYDGTGDSVVKIEHPEGVYVLYIKGNSESKHFAVKGYDPEGNRTELFVNTTEPYEGVTFDPKQETVSLEISSKGNWHIEIRSVWTCDVIKATNAEYSGTGDSIVLIDTEATMAAIKGNNAEKHFAMKSYGDRKNLMVNTTDAYSGTVMVKYSPYLLEVNAVGPWSITLE
ncbi:MAG: hypothetical protein K6C12_10270 [Oscillospiraceae bacterium]|nr:hypothetical protein [Oscillospiraceae bacterium]